jgi:GT2 family glycosyltransferase
MSEARRVPQVPPSVDPDAAGSGPVADRFLATVDARDSRAPSARPEISAIVCTRDRPAPALRCLESLRAAADRLPAGAVEILLIESGSDPAHGLDPSRVAAAGARLLRDARGGLSRARNLGLREARAPLLLFTDDDCRARPDLFVALRRHAAALDPPYALGGRVLQGDPLDRPFTLRLADTPEAFHRDRPPGGFLQGCNLALHRDAVDAVGLFDEVLGAGAPLRSGEDTDYLVRCHLAGVPILYEPDLVVWHEHGRRTTDCVRAVGRDYAVGNGAVYLRHWRQPWLWRQFYWVLRGALREASGGPGFDHANGLLWRDILLGNLAGMARLARIRLGGGGRAPSVPRGPDGDAEGGP